MVSALPWKYIPTTPPKACYGTVYTNGIRLLYRIDYSCLLKSLNLWLFLEDLEWADVYETPPANTVYLSTGHKDPILLVFLKSI